MIFSRIIQAISEKISVKIINICDTFDIKDIALIDGVQKEFQSQILYIGYYEQICESDFPPHCILVNTQKIQSMDFTKSDFALTDEKDLFYLFNLSKSLIDSSNSKGLYAELMDCAAQTRNISSFVNLSASKLGNSIVLLDSDYKVLAYSNIFPINDPLWELNIKQGYCSYEFISAVSELDSIKNAPKTTEPIVVSCYASPLRKLTSKVFYNSQMIGFVIMLEKETALSSFHFETLPIISTAAGDVISRFAPYLFPNSTHYQRLLYDLLIGAPPEKLSTRISKLSFPPNMCSLRISQSRDLNQRFLKEQVAEKLKSLFPGTQLTVHENGIAALLDLGDAPDITYEQIEILKEFAKMHELCIGISNPFSKIEEFAQHYSQAYRALKLDRKISQKEAVCKYIDYAFFDLLSLEKNSDTLLSFCHPALLILSKYDKENNSELFHTLEVYLSCNCNIKATSEKLYIHRNSLTYRLKRILELTEVNTDDANTRFLLVTSYRIHHFIKNVF